MRYRKTRDGLLEVSVIGVGTYAYAGVYGRKDPAGIARVLRSAYDLGVTMFDTGPGYGGAEVALGQAIKGMRTDVVISTKVPACQGGVACSYATIMEACDKSLERLGTDYIDLYQIHFDDGVTPVEDAVRAFEDLKAKGKIRAYGIGHVLAERAREYLESGAPSTVMGELSAVSRAYYTRMLPLLRTNKADYIGFSLTGRGLLTAYPPDREHLAPDDIRQMDAVFDGERRRSALRIRDKLGEVGRNLGATSAEVAIAWAISRERVLTGLVGPSTPDHLEEDLRAAELNLDKAAWEHLDDFLLREATSLATLLRKEITDILESDITDTESGASRLIYAMEGLSDLDLAREEDLVSAMGKVIKIMKSTEGGLSALDAIRRDLLRHVGI
jgi:aryl-alcohol dehydrogenase-like predicted oxidoreductase